MQNTWKPNCLYEENIVLKEKVEISSAKKENEEVVEINYLPPTGNSHWQAEEKSETDFPQKKKETFWMKKC